MSRRGQDDIGEMGRTKQDSLNPRPHSSPGADWSPGINGGIGGAHIGSKKPPKGRFNPSRSFSVSPSHMGETGGRKFNPAKTFNPGAGGQTVMAAAAAAAGSGAPLANTISTIRSDGAHATAHIDGLGRVGNGNQTSLYQSLYHTPLHPLQYHLYAPTPFRRGLPLERHQRTPEDLFMSNKLREELQDRNDATLQVLPASSLPDYVRVYHSLVPLDVKPGSKDRFGYETWRYKAVSNTDGRTYCLLRLEDFHLSNEHALQVINKWKRVVSAGVIGVIEAFTTLAFGPKPALIVVYEYWPLALPLAEVYDHPPAEGLMWALAAQLYSSVQAVHKRQLAVRILDTKRVLVTQKDRVRIGSCGVLDIVDYDDDVAGHLSDRQTQDWRDLGNVLRDLASPNGIDQKYSPDFAKFVDALGAGDASELPALIMPHVWRVLDSSLVHNDELEASLMGELENGRLVRLLAKLEYILNRPENEDDPDWSPTGSKYPLKLFQDFVFHQQSQGGSASLNLAHALTVLNKLDAGVDENILLTSSKDHTRVIFSFKQLKSMFEQEFKELSR